jgi:hypothetical protein
MKHPLLCLAVAAVGLVPTGCYSPDGSPNRAGTGALAGGAIGATSGALIGRSGEAALIGGAIGAITGGLIGSSMDQEERARLRAQSPQTYARIDQGQPLVVADVKAMARAGLADEVIISQIRATHTVYRLSAADIIDLRDAGVSQRVIEFMINTGTGAATATPPQAVVVVAAPPPPPRVETVVVAPGPGYVWVAGDWTWRGSWVWTGGYWAVPPRPGVVWVRASYVRGPRGWHHHPGHWR